MRPFYHKLLHIHTIAVLVTIIFLTTAPEPVQASTSDTETFMIQGKGMEPAIHENDVVVMDRTIPFDEVQIGDIIVFKSPSDSEREIVHRVVDITSASDGSRILRAKGDAEPESIEGTDYPITKAEYIGVVTEVNLEYRNRLALIYTPLGFAIVSGLIAFIVIAVTWFMRRRKRGMQTPLKPKSLPLTVLFAFLYPGTGHFYAGLLRRGLIFVGIEVGSAAIVMFFSSYLPVLQTGGIDLGLEEQYYDYLSLLLFPIHGWQIFDAAKNVQKLNARLVKMG